MVGDKRQASGRRASAHPTRNASWVPGRKGQGGEGLSKGYGGSAGPGCGPSGPENARLKRSGAQPRKPKTAKAHR